VTARRRHVLLVTVALGACTRPGEDRALAELDVGAAAIADASVEIAGGLAAVRTLADHRLELWAQAPVLELELVIGSMAGGPWQITVRNALPDAVLSLADGTTYARDAGEHPTVARFVVPLAAGRHALRLAPPDAGSPGRYRIAAMADIQSALPRVHEVFAAMSAVPDVRFAVGMGDITERAELAEYELYERQLAYLRVPYYTTIGNHELWADPRRFFDRFGRASFHFEYRGVAFSFADSGNAGIDPLVEEWLDGWLAGARDRTHVFLTHFPPIDPVGTRYGSFRSADDGRRLLARLADGGVDLTLYGHIHSYVAFDNAGIPAHVSGGGGAEPMRWDGIDRHFLMVELDPEAGGIGRVEVHRVD
jgi:3',5'-cyclic-AMP phosphodiesterase